MVSGFIPTRPRLDTSARIAALRDSTEILQRLDSTKARQDRIRKLLTDTVGLVPIEDPQRLQGVFQALKDGKKVRVAWFGDSFIEGDILVQDVRDILQKVFGGKGVGFLPATSVTAQFRQSIHHTFSDDWDEVSIVSRPEGREPGITGHAFFPVLTHDSDKASWIELKAASRSGSASFDRVRILYSDSKDTAARVQCADRQLPMVAGAGLHEAICQAKGTSQLRLRFLTGDSVTVHGVSVEGDTAGILVDNFSFRGNSGTGLLRIPTEALKQTNRLLGGYDLIVLEYGTNVTDAAMPGFQWYGKKLDEVIAHLRQAFPRADFLIVGVGDRGSREGEEIVSNPSVAKILEVQRQVARRDGAAFWDLRQAMGGENSMGEWSRAGLASEDYTHISPGGGRRLGKAFAKAFLKAWEKAR
jgi:lysophospholipase L1-like esterase